MAPMALLWSPSTIEPWFHGSIVLAEYNRAMAEHNEIWIEITLGREHNGEIMMRKRAFVAMFLPMLSTNYMNCARLHVVYGDTFVPKGVTFLGWQHDPPWFGIFGVALLGVGACATPLQFRPQLRGHAVEQTT